MSKSGAPDAVRNHILYFVCMHSDKSVDLAQRSKLCGQKKGHSCSHVATNIDLIQGSLKNNFPEIYAKNSNLTAIHRHLHQLKTLGLIESVTVNGETLYWGTREGWQYYIGNLTRDLLSIDKDLCEIKELEQIYRQENVINNGNPDFSSPSYVRIARPKFKWMKDLRK